MKKITFVLLLNTVFVFAQTGNKQNGEKIGPLGLPIEYTVSAISSSLSICSASVVPPTILNGVSVTANYTGSVSTYSSAYTACGTVTTPSNSVYLGLTGFFSYTMTFSQPINNLVFTMAGAGEVGNPMNEVFTIVTNGGIPAITSATSCYTTISGNIISSGANNPGAGGGGGIFTATAPSNFTSFTISGPGGLFGSLIAICSNSISTINCNVAVAPILSANSLFNMCPVTTINLNSITASNTPSFTGISLTWHTATPATLANELTVTQASSQVAGPTYYASFFDSVNNCYGTATPVTTVLNQIVTPTFTAVSPICSGQNLATLPTTSINGITGSWSPNLDNTATTTYSFTHNTGPCATDFTMQIVVNPILIPSFNLVNPICSGGATTDLPATSLNGVTGNWSPGINNTATTIYLFTPDFGQCSIPSSLQIVVNENPIAFIESGCNGTDYVLTGHSNIPDNAFYQWYDEAGTLIATTPSIIVTVAGIYNLIVSVNNCQGNAVLDAVSIYCDIQKGISPNDDGNNDFFDLRNLHVSNLQIFNRYGVLVYNKNNYLNEWEGTTNKDRELPDATYYYLIEFETGKSKTGWIYLNRQY